jgi:hypothetical protein
MRTPRMTTRRWMIAIASDPRLQKCRATGRQLNFLSPELGVGPRDSIGRGYRPKHGEPLMQSGKGESFWLMPSQKEE